MAWPSIYGLDVQHFQRQPTFPPRPAILLVHDAFHSTAHFTSLTRKLIDAGERVIVPQLQSSGFEASQNALESDVRALIEYGQSEIDNGRDIAVVAHGYGAIPASIATDRLNQYSLDRPRTGFVSRLILIAGVVLRPGQSYTDALEPEWTFSRNGLVGVHRPERIFFQDCPANIRAQAVASMLPQSESSLRTTVALPGCPDVPTLYIVCELDNAIPQSLQQEFVMDLRRTNRQVRKTTLGTGHCPFLTVPDDVAALILR